MFKKTRPALLLSALFLSAQFLSGCATPQVKPAEKITLSHQVWGYYQEYLADIYPNRPGAFAVSENGRNAYYYYCTDIRCMPGKGYKQGALDGCNRWGNDCLVFAYGRDILVNYEVEN
jgi:hypothetical protein